MYEDATLGMICLEMYRSGSRSTIVLVYEHLCPSSAFA